MVEFSLIALPVPVIVSMDALSRGTLVVFCRNMAAETEVSDDSDGDEKCIYR